MALPSQVERTVGEVACGSNDPILHLQPHVVSESHTTTRQMDSWPHCCSPQPGEILRAASMPAEGRVGPFPRANMLVCAFLVATRSSMRRTVATRFSIFQPICHGFAAAQEKERLLDESEQVHRVLLGAPYILLRRSEARASRMRRTTRRGTVRNGARAHAWCAATSGCSQRLLRLSNLSSACWVKTFRRGSSGGGEEEQQRPFASLAGGEAAAPGGFRGVQRWARLGVHSVAPTRASISRRRARARHRPVRQSRTCSTLRGFGPNVSVFVATDSPSYLEHVRAQWPAMLAEHGARLSSARTC